MMFIWGLNISIYHPEIRKSDCTNSEGTECLEEELEIGNHHLEEEGELFSHFVA